MANERKLIVRLARMMTDCMDVKLGTVKLDETRPEYWMLDKLLSDDMARLALKMGVRKPATAKELAGKMKWEEAKVQSLLDEKPDVLLDDISELLPLFHLFSGVAK